MSDKENKHNPFVNYGKIVWGSHFVGRKSDLEKIYNRVFQPSVPGNLAIIGEPRIGKSSLIWQSLYLNSEYFKESKMFSVWLNLATFNNSLEFFNALVEGTYQEILDFQSEVQLFDKIKEIYNTLMENQEINFIQIQRFFRKICELGFRIIFVIDEFDHARSLFQDNTSDFQKLRELSYNPSNNISYITTSRRTIRDIETQSKVISTLDGIFSKQYLVPFNESEILEYFQILDQSGINLTEDQKVNITSLCGGHPYLLAVLGSEIVNVNNEGKKVKIVQCFNNVSSTFYDYYSSIIELLKEENNLQSLFEILFKKDASITQPTIDKFAKFGLIQNITNEPISFSVHFTEFLESVYEEFNLWDLWSQVEIGLRKLIRQVLLDKFKANWISEVEKTNPTIIQKINEKRRIADERYGKSHVRSKSNIIYFTEPQDLFKLIFTYWSDFKPYLSNDQKYWEIRNKVLLEIRNPFAHNSDSILPKSIRSTAREYCDEIIEIIKKM